MYLGQLVEKSPTIDLFKNPLHPYTKALLSAVPSIDIHRKSQKEILKGELVSPINPKPGCRFAARCKYSVKECQEPQKLKEFAPNHFIACCRINEIK
jgi:peptide/nickel transport system ATP-binding protein